MSVQWDVSIDDRASPKAKAIAAALTEVRNAAQGANTALRSLGTTLDKLAPMISKATKANGALNRSFGNLTTVFATFGGQADSAVNHLNSITNAANTAKAALAGLKAANVKVPSPGGGGGGGGGSGGFGGGARSGGYLRLGNAFVRVPGLAGLAGGVAISSGLGLFHELTSAIIDLTKTILTDVSDKQHQQTALKNAGLSDSYRSNLQNTFWAHGLPAQDAIEASVRAAGILRSKDSKFEERLPAFLVGWASKHEGQSLTGAFSALQRAGGQAHRNTLKPKDIEALGIQGVLSQKALEKYLVKNGAATEAAIKEWDKQGARAINDMFAAWTLVGRTALIKQGPMGWIDIIGEEVKEAFAKVDTNPVDAALKNLADQLRTSGALKNITDAASDFINKGLGTLLNRYSGPDGAKTLEYDIKGAADGIKALASAALAAANAVNYFATKLNPENPNVYGNKYGSNWSPVTWLEKAYDWAVDWDSRHGIDSGESPLSGIHQTGQSRVQGKHADGGVTLKDHIARVGEVPEVIAPIGKLPDLFKRAMGEAGGSRPTVNAHVEVHVHGDGANAEEIARHVARLVPMELENVFEANSLMSGGF